MAIRAFLSFVKEDLALVNLFRRQAKAENFEREFADYSIKEPFDRSNTEFIRRGITEQLTFATLTICLDGSTTYASKWVDWELKKTLEIGKPLMGVSPYSHGRTQYCRPH